MKKIILALFALCCSLFSLALDHSSSKDNLGSVRSSKISSKISSKSTKASVTSKQIVAKRNTVNFVMGNKESSVCRVSCTYTVTTPDGQTLSYTASAGWFLMGCEAAGERACEKARLMAIMDFIN